MAHISTPWGVAEDVTEFGPGVRFVSTPSHGGFLLNAEANRLVPLAWQAASFGGQGMNGCYEEDGDACMVPLCFPCRFQPEEVARARAAFLAYFTAKGLNIEDARLLRMAEYAPELLEALRGLVDWGREHTSPRDPNSPHDLLVAASALLAKIGEDV